MDDSEPGLGAGLEASAAEQLALTPIEVNAGGPVVSGIDFRSEGAIFADGFESGDTSEWDSVVP